jgi:glycosyltransferase involved in cell wall biosynthesis
MQIHMAILTIGMPLFNNEKTLVQSIGSLQDQSYTDFRIIISDDKSTDGTEELCRDYVRRDNRIQYMRQKHNLNYGNFRFLLNKTDTPYFMWAAGDDWWDPHFIRENLAVLQHRDDVVLSVSKAMFVHEGKDICLSSGTYELMDTIERNLVSYLSRPSDNTRMYGIIRTQAAKMSFPETSFHAYDWAFSAASLLHGKHFEIPAVLMKRDYTVPSKYTDMIARDSTTTIYRFFPLLDFTRELIFKKHVPRSRRILLALADINLEKHLEYANRYHLMYARYLNIFTKIWRQHIAWRASFYKK